MNNGGPNVFVYDPAPITLAGAKGIFLRAGLSVVGAATEASDCVDKLDVGGPVIYVVDHAPAGDFGTRLIKAIIKTDETRRVVILSAFEHLAAIASAYEAGASAYVTKTADAREVLEVISAVHHLTHARDRVFPGSLAADLANFYISGGRGGTSPQARLTAQQLKVFQMMADGIRVKDIAMRLRINRRTVYNHVVAIRKRLNLPREHFRSCAIEHGLIDQ